MGWIGLTVEFGPQKPTCIDIGSQGMQASAFKQGEAMFHDSMLCEGHGDAHRNLPSYSGIL